MTLVPIAWSAGKAAAKSSAVPPTMMASVPSVARGTPPDTGASMKRTSRSPAAAAGRRQHAAVAGIDGFRLRRGGQHGDHDVSGGDRLGRGGRRRHPGRGCALDRVGIDVVSGHRKTLLDEILRHGQPHGPHADEADPCHHDPPVSVAVDSRAVPYTTRAMLIGLALF